MSENLEGIDYLGDEGFHFSMKLRKSIGGEGVEYINLTQGAVTRLLWMW